MNIEHLMNNEEFKAKLSAAENTAEMAEVFASYGVEVSEEELKEAMASVTAGEGGELSEDALDMVAGGGILDWLKRLIEAIFNWQIESTHEEMKNLKIPGYID